MAIRSIIVQQILLGMYLYLYIPVSHLQSRKENLMVDSMVKKYVYAQIKMIKDQRRETFFLFPNLTFHFCLYLLGMRWHGKVLSMVDRGHSHM